MAKKERRPEKASGNRIYRPKNQRMGYRTVKRLPTGFVMHMHTVLLVASYAFIRGILSSDFYLS